MLTLGCIGNDRRPVPEPMPLTDEAARARYHDILARGNTVLRSATVGYQQGDNNVYLFRNPTACEGETCTENFTLEDVHLQILGAERGVSRVNESFQDAEQRGWVYGGWMADSFFATQGNHYLDPESENYGITALFSYAVGYGPGTNPDIGSVSGRWDGIMLGVDVGAWPNRGDALAGDATIMVELAGDGMQADVSFTNIVDLLDVPRPDMTWEDLNVEAGRFGHDSEVGDNLSAAFFGADHGEVAGTFIRDLIIGSFGGVRE
jgi:hypothetical protein